LHFRKERIMNPSNHEGIEKLTETERRYKAMDMHLFNGDADEEKALCGAETSYNVRSVRYYLEDRVHGPSVRNVCQECKALAAPLAGEIIEAAVEEHEAKGRFDVAEDYRELAETLPKETGQDRSGD